MLETAEEKEEIRHLVVFVTTASKEEAMKIAEEVVEKKLGACVNIIHPVISVFTWKGKIEKAEEGLLIIKTTIERFSQLLEKIKQLHSYDVPEIIALPVLAGNSSYLNWIDEVCGKAGASD